VAQCLLGRMTRNGAVMSDQSTCPSDFPMTAPPAQRNRLRLAVWTLLNYASADGEAIVANQLLLHDNVIKQTPTKIGNFTDFMASVYHTALGSSRG